MSKIEKIHFLSKENDKKELLLENHESQVNLIESDTTIDNNEVKDSKFKLYEIDPIKSASCISKLLFYWAFRIIKVRNL
jgi:hypothetical protein